MQELVNSEHKYWSRKNRPQKAELQASMVEAILLDRRTDFHEEESGMSIVSLSGPNLRKVVELYWPLIQDGGRLYSVEKNASIFNEQRRHLRELPPSVASKVELNHDDWFTVAKRVAKWSQALYLEMDFCNSPDVQWRDGLGNLKEIVRLINPFTQKVYSSLTHTASRKGASISGTKNFMLFDIPDMWESCGWVCLERKAKLYKDGMSMMTAAYTFERRPN